MHPIKAILSNYNHAKTKGIYSVCSANRLVIKAAFLKAKERGSDVLIEATANQVNQFGGYTGMMPADFIAFCHSIADEAGLDKSRIIFGGDHLGPLVWQGEPEEAAMDKAKALVKAFVEAGFTKIHIDTSMRLIGDSVTEKLKNETIARRAAVLIQTCLSVKNSRELVFIIGSEVPVPGGEDQPHGMTVTRKDDLIQMIDCFKKTFDAHGLSQAWEDVVGVVVQPGVEFYDESVWAYQHEKAKELTETLHRFPALVFEGHSTDYQNREYLRKMVDDGIRILKVGPALTFYMREALFALANIENALIPQEERSKFVSLLDEVMIEDPSQWQRYYKGTESEVALKRKYSYLDRIRYYLADERVMAAQAKLIENISKVKVPPGLLSQFLPIQKGKVVSAENQYNAEDLILSRIMDCIDDYEYAVYR